MLLHEAFDKTLKYCRISATELAKISGVSLSRISQFRNGLSLKGKGSDLTGRAIDELINAAAEIQPKARLVFSLFLADQNPELIVNGSSWLDNLQLESMDATQISQLLIAIADTLDKSKRQGASSIEKKSEKHSLLNAS
jgi:transcriptional regulator with XRE-family HTH domain